MAQYFYALILLGLAGAALLASFRWFGHPFSPFGVFYGAWFVALSLFCAHWVEYIPLRLETWALLAANLLAFGFGWLLAHMLCGPAKPIVTAEFTRSSVSEEKFQKCVYALFMLGMVGAANFLWAIQRSMGLATYLTSPADIREAMGLGDLAEGLKPLNWLNVTNVVLCAFYLMILRGKRRKSIWTVLVLSLMATLIMEDRQRFFYAVLWASFVLAYSRKWTRREILFATSIVVVVLLVQFLAMATWLGKVTENNPDLVATANVPEVFHPLLTPYVYLTANFPALQEYISSSPAGTGGALTFYPVFRVAQLIDPTVKLPQVIGDFYTVPFEVNTFTWLYNFYTDFGIAGVVLGPWLVGLLSGLVYSRMRYSMSFYALYVIGLLSLGFAFSCFTNQFTQGPMWFFLAVGVPIANYVRCPEFQSSLCELA
jgi:oligosaccharide repeat unit polymerase